VFYDFVCCNMFTLEVYGSGSLQFFCSNLFRKFSIRVYSKCAFPTFLLLFHRKFVEIFFKVNNVIISNLTIVRVIA
jgi:hypothetical protein